MEIFQVLQVCRVQTRYWFSVYNALMVNRGKKRPELCQLHQLRNPRNHGIRSHDCCSSKIWSVVSMIQRENCVNIWSIDTTLFHLRRPNFSVWVSFVEKTWSVCYLRVLREYVRVHSVLRSSAADLGQRNKFPVINNCLWGASAWLQSSVRKWEIRKTEILTTILVSKIVILSCCEGMSGDVESTLYKNMHKHCNHMSDTCWTLLQIIVKTWWVRILKLKFTWSLTCSILIVKLDSYIFYILNLNKYRPWYLLPFGFVAMALAADFFLTTAIHLWMHL